MKNLLFLSLMLLAGTMCFGQEKSCVTWEESGYDIRYYGEVNFEDNMERYVGQKLSKLLNDIDSALEWRATPLITQAIGRGYWVFGIWVSLMNPNYEADKALYDQGKLEKHPTTGTVFSVYTEKTIINNLDLFYKGRESRKYTKEDFPAELGELIINNIEGRKRTK